MDRGNSPRMDSPAYNTRTASRSVSGSVGGSFRNPSPLTPASARRASSLATQHRGTPLVAVGGVSEETPCKKQRQDSPIGAKHRMDWFGEEDSDSPGGSESPAAVEEVVGQLVECSVPGCTKGKIDLSLGLRGSHKCRNCGQRFHATCAWEVSNSDDPSDCGCLLRASKDLSSEFGNAARTHVVQETQENAEEASIIIIAPPEDYNEEQTEAWDTVIRISQATKLRKLPGEYIKNWTEEQQAVWEPAREALNKEKRRLKAKTARCMKKAILVADGHTQEPDYRAAAGMPETSLSHKHEPPFSGHERARLVHCLVEPCMREYIPFLLRGATVRTEIDDKVRVVCFSKGLFGAMGFLLIYRVCHSCYRSGEKIHGLRWGTASITRTKSLTTFSPTRILRTRIC